MGKKSKVLLSRRKDTMMYVMKNTNVFYPVTGKYSTSRSK